MNVPPFIPEFSFILSEIFLHSVINVSPSFTNLSPFIPASLGINRY
jgi:hypothetical protein